MMKWKSSLSLLPALFGLPCLIAADHMHHLPAPTGEAAGSFQQRYDWFTNFGHYLPRIHCIQRADGSPDWPWIGVMLALNVTVIVGYLKIFRFWRQCYLAEAPSDRNTKLMDLAYIFLLCAACGYGFFIITLFWPAYRLLAAFMVALSVFTWRFAADLSSFRLSFSAKRLHRELNESLQRRNDELETLVRQRTAQVERADRFRSEFLANMSHELRTPMTSILGFADLLAAPDVERDEQATYVDTIRRNGRHLLGLVNDFLDLSKIEAGKMTIDCVPCDVVEQAAATIETFRLRAETQGISLAVAVGTDVPRRLMTDPLRLRQILHNLVGNAIKFTRRGGVTVTLDRGASVDATTTLRIDVRDTGCGIAAADLPLIFDRFGQAGPGRSSGVAGSGLGLTISRNLARLLGGDLTVSSVVGEGSTFTVTLAACTTDDSPAPAAGPDADADEGRPLDGLRVLVAEDMADTRAYIRALLDRWGASAEVVDNGRAAVDRGLAADFDLVLMDVQMPVLDGLAATRQLRDGGYAGPIIALTANALVGDRAACLAAGCSDYAAKPIAADALLTMIRRVRPAVATTV